ncbi:MAG TPA: helix-turn-helix domain-containing protein [Candidatus Limnocylindrales bacterium]|nr:helix-turn-helix domain-containing protein [Candidatus Limnocylindrales bacterium]
MDPVRFGRAIRALRRRRRLRQRDLAAAAGVSKSTVGRVEQGRIDSVAFGTLVAIGRELGARAEMALSWNGEALDRLLDEAHVGLVDAVVARLRALGWEVLVEASFAIRGERGSIDVLAWHPATGSIVVVEVKSVVPDVQATISTLDRKTRLAPIVARERGWTCLRVARLLVVGDARTSRRRVASHAETWRAAFPADRRQAVAWLTSPVGPAPAALLFVTPAHGMGRNRGAGGRHRVRVARPRSAAA